MKGIIAILLLLYVSTGFSQDVPPATEQQLENLGEETPEDDAFLQQLVYYRNNPLNLNTATPEDLYALRLLNELQVQSLIRHRQLFGKLLSMYELQAVQGFDLQTIRKLLPFIFVGEAQSMGEALTTRLRNGSRSILLRLGRILEKAKGYDTTRKTHYLGDPYHLQFRYTYQYKNLLYYGVVADKDAGEQFFGGAQRAGFDFYSVHLFARNLGRLKAVAVGDYVVNLGQGLTQWQSMGFGKSSEVLAVKRQAPVLLPYRSAGEFNFNRGVAATAQWGALEATTFVSYKKFSGNRVADSVDRFTSFGTSGYYRTPSEVEDRYRLSDFSAGANLSYNHTGFTMGGNTVFHRFSQALQKSTEPYNRFAFSGKTLLLGSVDYSFTYKNVHFFGEAAANGQRYTALVQGALVSIDPRLDLSFLYRRLQKEYSAPFGNAFTESALPANETGFYSGIQLRPSAAWLVSAYADVYHFPFLRYRVSSPARGRDFLFQVGYTPNKTFDVYLRFRSESKLQDSTGGVIPVPVLPTRRNLRLNFSLEPCRNFTVKGRLEKTWFLMNGKQEEGFLSFVETDFHSGAQWSAQVRLQYFQTNGYNTRIYTYESDVLYSFSIPAFSGRGGRYFMNLNWHLAKRWVLWARFAQTLYADSSAVGSGLEETAGNRRTELKAQVQFRF